MPDNRNSGGRGGGAGGKRNATAIISIILWALVITVLVNYATSMARSAHTQEITYGEFRQMVMDGKVEAVEMTSAKYTIYPKTEPAEESAAPAESPSPESQLGLPPLETLNTTQKTYYCAPPTTANVRDDGLIPLLEEYGVVQYGSPYEEPLSPIVSLLISYVLPMVLMVVLFSFLFRNMAGKMGGGIGNLIDRVLNGEVVDYINLLFMRFAVFNFADICVCVGVALWVLVIFLDEVHADDAASKEQ